ncbi:flagellar filament capping protein FliD [Alkalicoccus daliensis]|uniref:Flagellar hook-associated protein 2 n=1 Tax=Alkalicoccus daliensis TaxID=745820 RepID=A0A1H0JN10_9BACI|nr:flagellar filament capping protein FliD [Alkalicoccus daliensis]SDO45158.1 flagellar hook-associated protein 2 [Alkalicoccus daliensis]
MRLSGFATGMDINQMVKDLMQAEKMPLKKLEQNKTSTQWKIDQYREINVKMDKFRNNTFDNVMRRANMMMNTVVSSNASLVTATGNASTLEGTLRLTEVKKLASAASNASSAPVADKLNVTGKLSEQNFKAAEGEMWKTGTVNRQTVTVQQSQSTIDLNVELGNPDSTVVRVNGVSYKVVEEMPEGGLTATQVMLDADSKQLVFGSALARNAKVEVVTAIEGEGTDKFSMNSITTFNKDGQEVKENFIVTGNQTMNEVMSMLNRSKAGVSTFYDTGTDRVSIVRNDTGIFAPEGSEMRFSGSFFEQGLKLSDTNEIAAQNATFTINGLETTRRSNTFSVNGMNITLHETFANREVNLNVKRDTDKIVETIMSFVNEYNELLELVNGKTSQEFFRDYPPLTEEERRELSEREAELWDEKAMSGLLRNDSMLRNGMNNFRQQMYGQVTGGIDTQIRQLAQIGITTTSNFRDGGKLEVNEDRLRAAIESDAEGVYQLFAADGPTQAEQGIARRVRTSANTMIEAIAQRAGGMRGRTVNQQFTLGREMNNIEDRMTNFERRMKQVEQRYWTQFTAMEKAVSRANSQGEALFAQMYGGMQ